MRCRILPHIAALSLYLGISVLITYPLITVFTTEFGGHPFGDSYENARFAWWMIYALQNGQPLFEQPWLLYPHGLPSTYLWGIPLQSFPAWMLAYALPLPAAYNAQILLTLALNGWAMWVCARTPAESAAALTAGVVFMTFPTMQGHLGAGHVGLLAQWGLPLFAWWMMRYRRVPKRGSLMEEALLCVPGAMFCVITVLGSTQMAVFTTVPLAIFLLIRARADAIWLRRSIVTLFLGMALAAIFIVPAVLDTLRAPALVRDEGGIVRYSSDALAVVSPSPYHPFYAPLDYPDRVLGSDPFEGASYIGVVASGLALLGLWQVRAARWWGMLGVAAWILSLGPLLRLGGDLIHISADGYGSFVTLPYTAFLDVPLIEIVRAPGRFGFLIAFVMAVLAAYGMFALSQRLARRPRAWNILLIATAASIVLDYQLWWRNGVPHLPSIPAVIPEPIARLNARDEVRAVFHIPWEHPLVDKEALWLQTGYRRPMIAGHITRRTPLDPARGWLLQTLDPALLDSSGVDVIILHREWANAALETYARLRLGAPEYEDARLVMWEAPDAQAAPEVVMLLPDPTVRMSQADIYVYLPETAQIRMSGDLRGDASTVALEVDGVSMGKWHEPDTLALDVSLDLSAGYHTLRLVAEPACTQVGDTTLRCRSFTADVQISTPGRLR
jgi:hypothetical protein